MYLKTLLFATLSLLSTPFLASAQIKPGPFKVVCVIDADESPADLAREEGWKDPNVQGILIRQSWASLEPSEGTYNFQLFDQAVQLAQQNGKFVGLDLGAGSLSPKWVYAAGARPIVSKSAGQTQMMPVPWDPIFQSAWSSVIASLGNRYDTNPSVAYVVMSGIGRGYDSSMALNDDDVSQFDSMGGQLFWSHAANDIGDLFATSFPHTQIILPMDSVVPGADGAKMAGAVASEQMEAHSGQVVLDANSAAAETLQPASWAGASGLGDENLGGIRVGSAANVAEVIASALDKSRLKKAAFVEIDSHLVTQGDVQGAIQMAADPLGGPHHQSSSNAISGDTGSGGADPNQVVATSADPSSVADARGSTPSMEGGSSSTPPDPTTPPDTSTTLGVTTAPEASTPPDITTPPDTTTAPDASTATTMSTGSGGTAGLGSLSATAVSVAATTVTVAVNTANLTAVAAAAKAAAARGQPIWLSASTNGGVGTGTQSDPLIVPTAAALDAALYPLSDSQRPDLVFHFLAGTFYTNGDPHRWAMSTGWQFLGAGQAQTVLKIDSSSMTYTTTNKYGDPKQVIAWNGKGSIVLENMTLDSNAQGFGSQLATSFSMPAARSTVTVDVADSSHLTVGKWVYLQNGVPVNNCNTFYGMMEVTAIPSSTKVTLKNLYVAAPGTVTGNTTAGSTTITSVSSTVNLEEGQPLYGPGIPTGAFIISAGNGVVTLSAKASSTGTDVTISYPQICQVGSGWAYCPGGNVSPGTTIPPTARILAAADVSGLTAGGPNNTIKNITVENPGRPFYEGPAGIFVNGLDAKGGLIEGCTVKDIWGLASWIISFSSTNGLQLIDNSVFGNGYSQAYSFMNENTNATLSGNTAVNCITGIFSDTGAKSNFTVTGNKFQTMNGMKLAGAQFQQSTFTGNTFLLTGNGGLGMMFYGIEMTDCTFTKNTIQVTPGLAKVEGVYLNGNCTGTTGNLFSGNVIDSVAKNAAADSSYGTESGNVDQNGDPVSIGLDQ